MSIAPSLVEGISSVGAARSRNPVFMPLLRSLVIFVLGFYRHGAPTALRSLGGQSGWFQVAAMFPNPIRVICAICGLNIREICGKEAR